MGQSYLHKKWEEITAPGETTDIEKTYWQGWKDNATFPRHASSRPAQHSTETDTLLQEEGQWSQHPTLLQSLALDPPPVNPSSPRIPASPCRPKFPGHPSSEPSPMDPDSRTAQTSGHPRPWPHAPGQALWTQEAGLPTHISSRPAPLAHAPVLPLWIQAPGQPWWTLASSWPPQPQNQAHPYVPHASCWSLQTQSPGLPQYQANPLTDASTRQAHPRTPALSPP